ncbi:MAG: penicillin-insensitive murein endopeptidase [Deltaproteobacteria bacterium]|nr:penicillin-insensitive murein endopeptidase [Deltaproteobacteria bacterium]
MTHRLTLASLALAACAMGCSHVPSPLTPSVRGTVGLPHHGVLTDGVMLSQEGPAHRWFNPDGRHYGTREIVDAIRFASSEVRRQYPNSPPLYVGDLSGRRGGRIPGHASHRTGRDADLLFYMTTLSGEPIDAAGFVKFGADGLGAQAGNRGQQFVQFDLTRNWALVKGLVEAPGPGMVWVFVSRTLEALLTEYALARGEDPVLVWHAECVMQQPRNALPHDDHFHIRIACSPEQAVAGCEDSGPQWPWLPSPPSLPWPEAENDVYAAIGVDTLPPMKP